MNWLIRSWAGMGGITSLILLLYIISSDFEWSNGRLMMLLNFTGLLIHQFEEYVFPGGFKAFYNTNIRSKNIFTKAPLNDIGVLGVNVLLAWPAYGIAAACGLSIPSLAFGLLFLSTFNGILHLLFFVRQRKYNPGSFSAAFILIPFSIYAILKLHTALSPGVIAGSLVIFVAGCALVPAIISVSNKIRPAT